MNTADCKKVLAAWCVANPKWLATDVDQTGQAQALAIEKLCENPDNWTRDAARGGVETDNAKWRYTDAKTMSAVVRHFCFTQGIQMANLKLGDLDFVSATVIEWADGQVTVNVEMD